MSPVDAYVNTKPDDIRPVLKRMREPILRIAPEAQEGISYGMLAYKLNGRPLVYFAA